MKRLPTIGCVDDFAGDVVASDVSPIGWRLDDGLADHGHVHRDAHVFPCLPAPPMERKIKLPHVRT